MSEVNVIALLDSLLTENTGRIARYSKAADRDAERRGCRQEGADRMVEHAEARQESLKQARAAVAALQAEREWRPMDSVPLDGTPVLILILAYGTGPERIVRVAGFWDGMWRSDEEDEDGYHPPIAWQPLPAPPTTEGGES